MACPQIWNIEQEKDRKKEKVGGRPARLNENKGDRDLVREITIQRRHFLVGRTTWKFCSGGDKIRKASGHQRKAKISVSEKKVNQNTYDISSMKRVTKKFLKVLRCSRAKPRQRNVQKKCAARSKLLFCLLDLLLFFTVVRPCLPSPLSITVCLNKLNKLYILSRASLLALAKPIYLLEKCNYDLDVDL